MTGQPGLVRRTGDGGRGDFWVLERMLTNGTDPLRRELPRTDRDSPTPSPGSRPSMRTYFSGHLLYSFITFPSLVLLSRGSPPPLHNYKVRGAQQEMLLMSTTVPPLSHMWSLVGVSRSRRVTSVCEGRVCPSTPPSGPPVYVPRAQGKRFD